MLGTSKCELEEAGDGLVVKNTGCFSRGPGFDS